MNHLDGVNDASYRRWKGAEWWTEDIDGLWNQSTEQQAQEMTVDEPVPPDGGATAPHEQEVTEPTSTNAGPENEERTSAPVPVPSTRGKPRRPRGGPPPQTRASCSRESVVYLTADADEELLELKEGETYVIGGIVDRNRYKVSNSII
jgi:tRNA (guanine9-N1)-methyltransferase